MFLSAGGGAHAAPDSKEAAVTTLRADGPVIVSVGETTSVEITVEPDSAKGVDLHFESGNAGFFTVDEAGVIRGVHEGTSLLSVIAPNGVRTDIPVEVRPKASEPAAGDRREKASFEAPTKGIFIANEAGEIMVGGMERIIAHVLPYQVIGANPFTVSSSDPGVIEVIDQAKVIRALKAGTATIMVKTLDGQHQDSVTFTVVPRTEPGVVEGKTYILEPERFGIAYDASTEQVAKANSAGLYQAMRYTVDHGYRRLLLQKDRVLYIEPKDTIHMVSNVQLDLNGSEVRLRPNDYARYTAFLFAEKDSQRVLENASIVNGMITGERDEKGTVVPEWFKDQQTEGGVTIVFEEGHNNGIRDLTVRKSIGFNISSGLGSKSHAVQWYAKSPVSADNLQRGGFDDAGEPTDSDGRVRTKQPIDVSAFTTPYYDIGYPLGYMNYPYMNSRIYDAYFYDKDMQLIRADRGRLRYRQYSLPEGAAYLHMAFYMADVPAHGNSDFGNAVAFIENRAMPTRNFMVDCVIEDNYSCGFAACGGQGWIITGNVFRRNGGRMPGSDIDWEDGWEYMQGDLVRGNRFESRVNVITCAGVGLIFDDNDFLGQSIFWGRSQHYSLINNRFAKDEAEDAAQSKVSFASQTDVYCYGNTYRNGIVSYSRQHAKEPFVGKYQASFIGETFDNTQVMPGHIERMVDCTFLNGTDYSMIHAEVLDHCTIKKGSYNVGAKLRHTTIENAIFRVLPEASLWIEDSTLHNPSFEAPAPAQGLTLDRCGVRVDRELTLVTPNHMDQVTLRDTTLHLAKGGAAFALVGGWNAAQAHTKVTLDHVTIDAASGVQGYLHKFAWYPAASDPKAIRYVIRDSDLSKLRRTDEKGERSNVVFQDASP